MNTDNIYDALIIVNDEEERKNYAISNLNYAKILVRVKMQQTIGCRFRAILISDGVLSSIETWDVVEREKFNKWFAIIREAKVDLMTWRIKGDG